MNRLPVIVLSITVISILSLCIFAITIWALNMVVPGLGEPQLEALGAEGRQQLGALALYFRDVFKYLQLVT